MAFSISVTQLHEHSPGFQGKHVGLKLHCSLSHPSHPTPMKFISLPAKYSYFSIRSRLSISMPLLSSKPSPCLAWRTLAASSPLSRDHVSSPGKPFSMRHPEWRLTDLPLQLNHLAPFPSHLCLTRLPRAPNALAAWPFLLHFSSESPHQSLCACSCSLQRSAPVFT